MSSDVLLRYRYELNRSASVGIEVIHEEGDHVLYLNGQRIACIKPHMRNLAFGPMLQFKPDLFARQYYATLQDACEAVAKKLHREKKIPEPVA